jgi:hypothetical protein
MDKVDSETIVSNIADIPGSNHRKSRFIGALLHWLDEELDEAQRKIRESLSLQSSNSAAEHQHGFQGYDGQWHWESQQDLNKRTVNPTAWIGKELHKYKNDNSPEGTDRKNFLNDCLNAYVRGSLQPLIGSPEEVLCLIQDAYEHGRPGWKPLDAGKKMLAVWTKGESFMDAPPAYGTPTAQQQKPNVTAKAPTLSGAQ